METIDRISERLRGPPTPTEDDVTKSIEPYTAAIPSSQCWPSPWAAMALSVAGQLTGRGKCGNFIAQWGTHDPHHGPL